MISRPWLIDSAVFIRAVRERGHLALAAWLDGLEADGAVTCDLVRAEFLVGMHSPKSPEARAASRRFFEATVKRIPSLPCDLAVMERAGELAGQARRRGYQVKLTDAVIAAAAEREGRTVATTDVEEFRDQLGVSAADPLAREREKRE